MRDTQQDWPDAIPDHRDAQSKLGLPNTTRHGSRHVARQVQGAPGDRDVGGESGKSPRPMDANWVRDIRDQCVAAGVAFHFKQWGGLKKKEAGRILDGRTWDEFPVPRLSSQAA